MKLQFAVDGTMTLSDDSRDPDFYNKRQLADRSAGRIKFR